MTTISTNTAHSEFGRSASALRVLVAEDNKVNQTFISHVLTQLGISYRFAEDGLHTVQTVDEEKFDVVFMDLHMPNMDGLEACKTILAKPQHSALSIVGLTSESVEQARDACMSAGMKDFISKPFKRSDIETALIRLGFKIAPIPMHNFDHDKELLKITIDLIAAEIPLLLNDIEKQLQQEEWPEVKRGLHTLKGHCKLVGELDFADFLQQMENEVGQGIRPATKSITHMKTNLKNLQHRLCLLSQ